MGSDVCASVLLGLGVLRALCVPRAFKRSSVHLPHLLVALAAGTVAILLGSGFTDKQAWGENRLQARL